MGLTRVESRQLVPRFWNDTILSCFFCYDMLLSSLILVFFLHSVDNLRSPTIRLPEGQFMHEKERRPCKLHMVVRQPERGVPNPHVTWPTRQPRLNMNGGEDEHLHTRHEEVASVSELKRVKHYTTPCTKPRSVFANLNNPVSELNSFRGIDIPMCLINDFVEFWS